MSNNVVVPAWPLKWAKAGIKLGGALICLCKDGMTTKEGRMESFCMKISLHSASPHTLNRKIPAPSGV